MWFVGNAESLALRVVAHCAQRVHAREAGLAIDSLDVVQLAETQTQAGLAGRREVEAQASKLGLCLRTRVKANGRTVLR
mgnify:CR=1 FL=1